MAIVLGLSLISEPKRKEGRQVVYLAVLVRIIFHPQPPSLLILLSGPGSERKVLTKET